MHFSGLAHSLFTHSWSTHTSEHTQVDARTRTGRRGLISVIHNLSVYLNRNIRVALVGVVSNGTGHGELTVHTVSITHSTAYNSG